MIGDNAPFASTFQEPLGDALSHHGADGESFSMPSPPTHLPPHPPALSAASKFGPTPSTAPVTPVQPSNGTLDTHESADFANHPITHVSPGGDALDHEIGVESVTKLESMFEKRPGTSEKIANAAAVNLHTMEEEVAELPTTVSGLTKTHRGSMDGMSQFFKSWWGMTIIIIIVLALVITLLVMWGHRKTKLPGTPEATANNPSPTNMSPPHHQKQHSGEDVTVYLAWEASRDPTLEDKIILFNVGSPDIAWSCCAQSIFNNNKNVHVKLPPGNYAARTVHKNGMQQVCSLETARRVAFTDTATRCSQAVPATSTEINLGTCDTIITD